MTAACWTFDNAKTMVFLIWPSVDALELQAYRWHFFIGWESLAWSFLSIHGCENGVYHGIVSQLFPWEKKVMTISKFKANFFLPRSLF